ncbi:MAG TPA: hypothetical protein VG387_18915 [Rhizomicrobium sp.]|nr:hypothetical protein [Rhizomicrobium sp.]
MTRLRVLDAPKIVLTIERLQARITERFPDSGLSRVAADLADTARVTVDHNKTLNRPNRTLQVLAALAIAAGIAAQVYVARLVNWSAVFTHADVVALTQGLDAIVNLLILAAGALWFLLTLDRRLKRRAALRALFELRSFAHVVDMHQLTKDPTVILGPPTPSSPQRRMSEFELSRYLDYCAEMLALIAKLAALYAGQVQDEAVIGAVNEIEALTSDLGRKIWQKIMIISRLDERAAR